ncbi:MAG: IS91 family transposase [Erysipelotrichaceae bacterium]|nr:IS91 family transposase [Erysipelotrichaceae bacterium]
MDKFFLDSHHLKAYNYMAACGTDVFGFNAYECEDCDYKRIHYNSCGNRNCPSCQAKQREEWISKMSEFLLDIPYFHVVFTVPDSLNDIFLYNKKKMYNLLFSTSSKTLLKVSEKYYGQVGFTSILHTWGQNLWIHPHIHMIVSGGGLTIDENGNDIFKKAPANYLVPVKALSKMFRGKFIDGMKKLLLVDNDGNPIDFNDESYKTLIDELYSKDWVVYSKKPFNNNQAVLNYIGRYSHRVAITNSRILNYDETNHTVTFRYKDYKDNSKQKEMTLDALEFIRRFMMHIVPYGFIKIRHYGFMSNNTRKTKLPLCRELLGQPAPKNIDPDDSDPDDDQKDKECRCPKCGGKLIWYCNTYPTPWFHDDDSS